LHSVAVAFHWKLFPFQIMQIRRRRVWAGSSGLQNGQHLFFTAVESSESYFERRRIITCL
jgi:hypothetical protein